MDMRMLLFSGGRLGKWALSYIKQGDILVGVDRGAHFLIEHGKQIDIAIGDFDSVSDKEKEQIKDNAKEFITCDPIMKDETDTEMAFSYALKKLPEEILLFGAIGTRMDHSLANIHLLVKTEGKGIPSRIIDEYNEIQLTNDKLTVYKDHFDQISLLPLSMKVTGITLTGFRYPLTDATLEMGHSLGISNVLEKEKGTIEVVNGRLLVIKSRD